MPFRITLVVAALAGLAPPVSAQNEPLPFVSNEWTFGRRTDEARLRFCVDARDPEWQVAREIGEAVAGALLLEPVVHEITTGRNVEELDELYGTMLEHCSVHMGFKLLPGAYPQWLTVTRPYYNAAYVFVTDNPEWDSLGEVPPGEPIASTMGTGADLRLISYLLALPADERWARFPMGTNAQTLEAVLDGVAPVALVWEPALWAARNDDPAYDTLRVIGSDPLPETVEGIGAAVLAGETFLRTSLDQAIAALSADGTIAEIIERHGLPAHVAQ